MAATLAVGLIGAVGLVWSGSAAAQDVRDPDLISVGVGWFDFNDDKDAVDLRVEYRPGVEYFGFVKPWAGLEATTDGALYGVAGVLVDFDLTRRIVVTPSFGAGLYADGDGKDLGHVVEFRSQLEVGYKFNNGSRVGLAVSHISNASLDDANEGTEVATLYYHLPVGKLFGN